MQLSILTYNRHSVIVLFRIDFISTTAHGNSDKIESRAGGIETVQAADYKALPLTGRHFDLS